MKKILLLAVLTCNIIFAQELKYEEVVKVDSATTKDELFNRARAWAKENYNSKNNIIITEDRASGEISGLGIIDYRTDKKYTGYSCVEGPIKYSFSVYTKDGRYKYIFHSFDHKGSSGNLCRQGNFGRLTMSNDVPPIGKGIAYVIAWEDVKEKISNRIMGLIAEIEKAMNKKHETSNDW